MSFPENRGRAHAAPGWTAIAFFLSCIFGVLAFAGAASAYTVGTGSMTVAGQNRTYTYYVPTTLDAAKGVVIFLHGVNGSGSSVEAGNVGAMWNAVAEAQGFLMIYPDGKPETSSSDPQHVWNDCRDDVDTTSQYYTDWDDVAYINALIGWASGNYGVATTRVYIVGHSNGSMMAMRYAMEAPTISGDVVPAAISAVAGNLPVNNDNHTGYYNKCAGYVVRGTATPILLVKGDTDPIIPFGDSSNPPIDAASPDHNQYCIGGYDSNNQCLGGAVKSYYDTLAFWQWKNSLSSSKTTVANPTSSSPTNYADYIANCTTLSNRANCDGSTASRWDYGSSSPYPVEFLRLNGGGHQVPVSNVETLVDISTLGWTNRDKYDSGNYLAQMTWDYLYQFHR